ncbi:CD209 antigen-like [Notolabrus celidotus]|uniref:CD209 antigen-like n=1 Tax=Notolabrus celidotus TaxID=1203425 RepID=UPI00148F999A|nr:CD209 antigen-like [Notolabrus celidotus]
MEDAEMDDEYLTSNSKIGYKQLIPGGNKLQNSVHSLRNNPFRVATLCLSLLCLLLLVGVIVQTVQQRKVEEDHHNKVMAMNMDKANLQEKIKAVHMKKRVLESHRVELQEQNQYFSKRTEKLQTDYNAMSDESNNLKASKSQLQTSHATLSQELEQLKVSKDQLQTANIALSKDKELLQKQHDRVLKRKNELHANVDSVTKERDTLESKIQNRNRSKGELQISYNNLTREITHVEKRYNFSSSEKGKLESSHQNLTETRDILLEVTEVLKKAIAQLEIAYGTYENEQHELRIKCDIEVQETEKMQHKNSNLTAERDQLQAEAQRLNETIHGKRCSNGWRIFENNCYFTSVLKKTWNGARTYCKSSGADLAIVKSQDEMDFINGLYESDKEVWIGLTDDGVEGQWKWVDGTPLNTTFWGKGQPNSHNGKDQDCVEFWHRSSGRGEWNDENCNQVQYFICAV